jgi:hypothetical protein
VQGSFFLYFDTSITRKSPLYLQNERTMSYQAASRTSDAPCRELSKRAIKVSLVSFLPNGEYAGGDDDDDAARD